MTSPSPSYLNLVLTLLHQIDYDSAATQFGSASANSMATCTGPIIKKFREVAEGKVAPPAAGNGIGTPSKTKGRPSKRKNVDEDGDDEVAPTPKGKGGKKVSPAKKPKKEEAVDDGE